MPFYSYINHVGPNWYLNHEYNVYSIGLFGIYECRGGFISGMDRGEESFGIV